MASSHSQCKNSASVLKGGNDQKESLGISKGLFFVIAPETIGVVPVHMRQRTKIGILVLILFVL